MTDERIYRVAYVKASGRCYSSLISAADASRAIMAARSYDPQIVRVTSATIATDL